MGHFRTLILRAGFLSLALIATCFSETSTYTWEESGAIQVAEGVLWAKVDTESPRKLVVNCVRVDSCTRGIAFETTGRAKLWKVNKEETWRQTTRDFLRRSRRLGEDMVVAINADAFSPWPAPYNISTATNIQGLAISGGTVVSPPNGTPSLLIGRDGSLRMVLTDANTDVSGVNLAVSGFGFCLQDGAPVGTDDINHPRTGFGLSQDSRYLYLMTVDGRRHASLGCTIQEVGEWLRYFGAHTGINMDGGGSTTLVRWNTETKSAEFLNQPVGDGQRWHERPIEDEQKLYQPTERANGNNFGIVLHEH